MRSEKEANKTVDKVESTLRKVANNSTAELLGSVEQQQWGHFAVA